MIDPNVHYCTIGFKIKKLLVFELEGIFLYKSSTPMTHKYLLRSWLKEVFENVFKIYDVGIWCALDMKTTLHIVKTIFSKECVCALKFVKCLWHVGTENTIFFGFSNEFHFKPLVHIWKECSYDKTNTVLMDSKDFHG
jgi:hypothetical protein